MSDMKEIKYEHIRKSLKKENFPVLEINIEYPQINEIHENKSLVKFNEFYKTLSNNYLNYCENILSKKMTAGVISEDFRPHGELMKCFVSIATDEYISVVTDITHFDGYFKRYKRFSHTWLVKKAVIIPCEYFIDKMNKKRKQIVKEIGDMIIKRIGDNKQDFSYTQKSINKFAYRADLNKYFICKNGIAFWFEPGTIAPESEGFPTYVIPFDEKKTDCKNSP